jgi:general secretion pathway protein J
MRQRSPRQRRRRIAGFTLLEALMATALMGAILSALATVTAQWLPNWNRGFARVQRTDSLALGLERLVADVSAAEFVPGGRETLKPYFDGTELSLTFIRTALGPNARPGLEIIRIGEAGSERGPVMVRMRAPFVPIVQGVNDRDQPAFADPVVLVRAPYRVSFSYAGADRIWQPVWRDAQQLPRAIRVTLRDAATQRTLSASTAALVHAELPASCVQAKSLNECFGQLAPGKEREL